MAAASTIVELCTLADDAKPDAATSAKFFCDDDDGAIIISSFSWPEAGRTPSSFFDQSLLQALCEKYKVPAEYTRLSLDARWRVSQTPPEGAIFVYADALEAGMRIPLHDFYLEVLGHYGLAPSQLTPDAWRYMAAFVMLSQDAGVEPSLPAFGSFFSICTHDGASVGWHHFRSRLGSSCCLFNGEVLRRSPDPEWKSRFFLLRPPPTRPWPCPVKWGKPSRAAVRMPVVTGETEMVMKKLLDTAGSLLSWLSPPVAPIPRDKAVKVEAAGDAAVPPQPPPPPPPPLQEPTRKRKLFSDTHTRPGRELVDCIGEALELAEKAMAELDEKGKELEATRGEVAELKEALSTANADHAAEVRRLADGHRKAAERAAEHHKAEIAELQDKQAAAIARLKQDHAISIGRLREERAVDVARVMDAAEKEVQDAKKKIVLRLFPTMDVSLLERPKLKGDRAAATGTPKR